jgi:hypothetical protein
MKIAFALAAAALLALGGCSRGVTSEQARQYNNALVDAYERIGKAMLEFGQAAGAALEGQTIEVAKAKREHENLADAVTRTRADIRIIQMPKSETAKAFYDEVEKLLASQEKMVKEDMGRIVKVLEDPSLNARERQRRIVPMAQYLESMDRDAYGPVLAAQAEFARAHGFQLTKRK